MPAKARTRYAPSPTGFLHIGNLRTALYEYLIAKSLNGSFILRIEDTDQERYVEGAVEAVYKTLELAGLKHDEGPDIGGDYGPYVQSSRKHIYIEYARKLVGLGAAYYCFCSRERLDELKNSQEASGTAYKYDRKCCGLSKAEIENRLSSGAPYVIRQKIPEGGASTFQDAVYGTLTVDNSQLDDQVLIKSDGLPTYNFANVVDDHLMEITHVVRGNEYLSSTPKYNLLYDAFGWEIPVYIHLPLITKEGGQKLGKRYGDPSFIQMVEQGYLPEAIVNYVALLGWSPGTTQEIFTLAELELAFSIDGINKAPAVLDMNKLNWMNGEYIRRLPPEKFHELALPWISQAVRSKTADLEKISRLLQVRTEVLGAIPATIDFIDALPDYDIVLYTHKKMKTDSAVSLDSLKKALPVLEGIPDWNEQSIGDTLAGLIEKLGVKNSQVLWPVRTAISGKQVTPGGAIEIAAILGKDETLKRISFGIEKLSQAV